MNDIKYNILCVDDVEANLFSLEQILKRIPQAKILKALSGDEALNTLLEQKVDLILLDIQMPGLDGYEVAKLVKKNKITSDIPIIFLTAVFKSEEFIAKGFEVGAIDYLTKPLDDNQLINRIELYLNIFRQRDYAKFMQKEYQSITDSMAEGLCVIDSNSNLEYINQSALNQLGFKSKELLSKKFHDTIHYKDCNEHFINKSECKILNTFITQESFFGELCFIKKDSSSFLALVSATPIIENSKAIKVILIFQDLTEELKKKKTLIKLEQEKNKKYSEFIDSLVSIIEKRDAYTAGHSQRVANYCKLIAKEMNFKKDDIDILVNAARLHDIGKISTPDSVLLKPSFLDKLEYTLIQDHLISGYEILSSVESYKEEAEIMRYHHERYDGKGYPYGKRGDEISMLSHIMIVADAFDAMTTNRIYKPRMKYEDAIKELITHSSKQFHPKVVESAIKALKDVDITEHTTQLPKNELENHRLNYFFKDKLTKLFLPDYERLVVELYFSKDIKLNRYYIRLNNFNSYNKNNGWDMGDKLLASFAKWLMNYCKQALIFRIEGDDFMVVTPNSFNLSSEMIKTNSPISDTEIGVTLEVTK
jgi:PAS domain S-box-containing protein/putative nucleotidyltransferase with HDIG domain